MSLENTQGGGDRKKAIKNCVNKTVATVDNWCKRYFRTVALRDSETEVSIHNSCSLLTEGCSWER